MRAEYAGRDSNGYMIACEVSGSAQNVELASWDNVVGNSDAKWQNMVNTGNGLYKLYVNYSTFNSKATTYYNDCYVTSYSGERIKSSMITVLREGSKPKILSADIMAEDSGGYMLRCVVDDQYTVKNVKVATWTDVGGTSNAVWHNMDLMEKKPGATMFILTSIILHRKHFTMISI